MKGSRDGSHQGPKADLMTSRTERNPTDENPVNGEKGKYRGWGGAGVEVGGAQTTAIWKGLFR